MCRYPKITYPETPTGKRKALMNIYGNIVGYVSGKRFWEFGTATGDHWWSALAWVEGKSLEEAAYAVPEEKS